MSTRTTQVADREKTAERLLNSSARNSYDPQVDIDWDAPLLPGTYYLPQHRISLYGTDLWEQLTEEQRIELSKHEVASMASNGIWFEVILMQLLTKYTYRRDPTRRHVQYALTEVADECRHSIMFARMIEKFGCPAYGPQKLAYQLGKVLTAVGNGPSMFAAILIAEEVLDRLQRESMADESIQPLVRMVNRIHVVEEARHVRFAREEVVRTMRRCGPAARAHHRMITALNAYFIVNSLIHPRVYAAVGLDPVRARKAALANPHYQQTLRWAGERIVSFLDEVGLIGNPGMSLWRKSFLIA
ncbi:MAG TPA: diiron oxygenase [Pseudonocardiaceae bacterium]